MGTNDTARFSGPTGIANILSRVTGGQQSVIDGRLQSTIPGANLYLLNPSGVVFGPTASLDVSGSFHVSTADYLRFADGTTFAAHLGAQSSLTVAAPAAFGFLGPHPSGIAVQGSTLTVPSGKTLSLVGGDIAIVGGRPTNDAPPNVAAPGGRITIASVASAGEVVVPVVEQTPALDMGAFARLGTITLEHNARLEASGPRGGTVVIRGGQLSMDGGQIVANTGVESGASPGIDMQITDAAVFTNNALLTTEAGGTGKAGDIHLTAHRVEVHKEVRVGSVARSGSGSAGNVTITATAGSVLVTGDNAIVESRVLGNTNGDAGQVTITADTLTVEHGGEVRTSTRSAGSAGTVTIQVGQLTLTNGGRIEANVATEGTGDGRPGSITVTATDHVTIDGANNSQTGLVSQTNAGSRSAGMISVQTGHLEITGGGQISTNTVRGSDAGTVQIMAQEVTLAGRESRLTSTTTGSGNAGHIRLEVGRLTITDGAQIDTGTASGSRGQAGTITIQATDAVTLASTDVTEARLVSRAAGSGNGGQITIATPRLEVASGGRISAIAFDGQDGRIDVTAVGSLILTGGIIDRREIHLDGSLGPSRLLEDADITIEAQLGQIHGANLFHSFSRFRLLPGGTVTFTGPSHVTTILSRVTGAEPALIEGTLRSDIPGASLFFLAPRGVLFGAGARLELTGAVHVSTADALRLDDGGRFGGSGTEASLLTAGRPVAFGFTTLAPAPITLRLEQWPLTVRGGTRFSLVGGDITLATGELQAPGIPVHLVSVGSPGEVLFTPSGDVQAFQLTGFSQGGRLTFSERTRLTTQAGRRDAGPIELQAAHVTLMRDAEVTADASPTGHAGRILITAEDTLTVTDGRLAAATQGPGNAGEIVIRAGRLDVTEGGLIAAAQDIPADAPADVQGSGQGGRIHITATAVHVGGRNPGGQPSRIEGSTDGSGAGGAIDLQVHTLAVTEGGQISTGSNRRATGAGGLLRVTATGDVTIAGSGELRSRTFGRGRGGDIEVRAARVRVMDGGRIDTRTFGTDPEADNAAGTILINTGRLEVTGGGQNLLGEHGVVSRLRYTDRRPPGRYGSWRLRCSSLGWGVSSQVPPPVRAGGAMWWWRPGTLTLLDGARLDSNTGGGGQGGTVTVTATDAVTVSGRQGTGLFTNTTSQGTGGDIVLHTRAVQLTDGATVSAQSTGTGSAGNVRILAVDTLLLSGGSTVTTGATHAAGGNIVIAGQTLVRLRDSQITTAVGSGEGAGGNITIDPASEFVVLENSQLTANAFGGPGGDITIRAGVFLTDPPSRITASSVRECPWEINIQAQITNLSGLVTPLPPDFAPVGALLHDSVRGPPARGHSEQLRGAGACQCPRDL